eukprot:842612-Amphidinium_carterae.1
MVNCVAVRKDKQPICFKYNLPEGCPSGKGDGERCPRGWHVCARDVGGGVACAASHSQLQHV